MSILYATILGLAAYIIKDFQQFVIDQTRRIIRRVKLKIKRLIKRMIKQFEEFVKQLIQTMFTNDFIKRFADFIFKFVFKKEGNIQRRRPNFYGDIISH